jgi:hypothetical protein
MLNGIAAAPDSPIVPGPGKADRCSSVDESPIDVEVAAEQQLSLIFHRPPKPVILGGPRSVRLRQ